MEDKKDKKIRLLSQEIDRLTEENKRLVAENTELQTRINELSSYDNEEKLNTFKKYENELKEQIEKAKKLNGLYEQLVEKQKKYISKEF